MTCELVNIKPAGRYSKKATAALLGISRSTLDRHTFDGPIRRGTEDKIHAERHASNGRRLFRGTEILRYFNNTK